jgi:hypothetical protein
MFSGGAIWRSGQSSFRAVARLRHGFLSRALAEARRSDADDPSASGATTPSEMRRRGMTRVGESKTGVVTRRRTDRCQKRSLEKHVN